MKDKPLTDEQAKLAKGLYEMNSKVFNQAAVSDTPRTDEMHRISSNNGIILPSSMASICRDFERELTKANKQLEKEKYISGLWQCVKCQLRLISKTLHVLSGSVSGNNNPEECPNCAVPMWRVTYKDEYEQLIKENNNFHKQLEDAKSYERMCDAITKWLSDRGRQDITGKNEFIDLLNEMEVTNDRYEEALKHIQYRNMQDTITRKELDDYIKAALGGGK